MRAKSGIVRVEILDNKTTADMTGDRPQEGAIMTKCLHHPHCRPKEVPDMWENREVVLAAAKVDI
jgi:hypothetical protein